MGGLQKSRKVGDPISFSEEIGNYAEKINKNLQILTLLLI